MRKKKNQKPPSLRTSAYVSVYDLMTFPMKIYAFAQINSYSMLLSISVDFQAISHDQLVGQETYLVYKNQHQNN